MRFRFFDKLSSSRTQRQVQNLGGGVLSVITYPVVVLARFGKASGHVIAGWWESRNLRFLLQGLPALVVSIGIIVVGALVFFQDRSALAQEYKDLAQRAQMDAAQQYRAGQNTKETGALAQTCFKYLGVHPPYNTPENSFHMAETYMLQRQPQAAQGIFEKLAPLDSKAVGYGPAHLEVAQKLLPPYPPGTPLEKQQQLLLEAENHLRRAVQFDKEPYASGARAHLFDVLRITNRPEEAEKHLRDAVRSVGSTQPQYRRMLANWYLQEGKRDLAEREIEQAAQSYEKKVAESLSDDNSRLMYIDTLRVLGRMRCERGDYKKGREDFARAKEASHTGKVMASEPNIAQRYKIAFYAVLLTQYDGTANEGKGTPDETKINIERFAVLEEALNLFPNFRDVLERLAVYLRDGTPEEIKRAKEAIAQNIAAGGQDSAIGHMILGTEAYKKNPPDIAEATYHWELAVKANPEGVPQVANNLAWLLAFNKPYDYDRAIMLVNKALETQYKPEFRSTRGHILKKMGRARDAYPDLQEGLKPYSKDPVHGPLLYDALIEVATDLGLKSEAEQYKKMKDALPRRPGQPAPPAAVAQPPTEKKDAAAEGGPEKKDGGKVSTSEKKDTPPAQPK
jgi:tetratricopeptide (TPR) repeat protein